ncbi:MAG: LytR C-terminal domain-containing protein [Kineosporiaceae bacterium]|nr:LytR C-terminal domain-containing protein [Kineosporiaceae bacterium]MBK8075447.1 LytR C-terminal domain-containing protein [Kineosporiaceae bacterium]
MAGREDDSWHTEEIGLPGTEDDGPGAVFPGRTAVRTDLPTTSEPRGITRRERRQTITFLVFFSVIVVLGLLALAAYFGKLDFGVGSGKPAALPTCPSAAPSLQPNAVSVNVYNASSRNGLALATMRDLQKRGFKVPAAPANDPMKSKVTTMAVVRHGPTGDVAAKTVAAAVAGEVTFVQDDRTTSDVDLVLGQTFKLKPIAAAAPGTPSAPAAEPTCVPAEG